MTTQSDVLHKRARGWGWVAEQFAVLRDHYQSEAERLLGPDRGE